MIRDNYEEYLKFPQALTVEKKQYFRPFKQLLFKRRLSGNATQELVSGWLRGIQTITHLLKILGLGRPL
jgi:hypothetical protein